jgi:hypothetical protein
MTDFILKKSLGPLSSGTRLKLRGYIEGTSYAHVQLFSRPESGSDFEKLCKKYGASGIFEIESDLLVRLRETRNGKTREELS